MTNEQRIAIESQWTSRAAAQGLKPGTKTYQRAEVEFFTGAMAAINALLPHAEPDHLSPAVPVIWVINAMSGRPIVDAPAKATA